MTAVFIQSQACWWEDQGKMEMKAEERVEGVRGKVRTIGEIGPFTRYLNGQM